MKNLRTLALTGLISLPLALPIHAVAQTANAPGGSVSTGTPLDQTKATPATPSKTSTSPTATNPTGALPRDGTATDPKMKKGATSKASESTTTKDVAPTR